MYDPGMLDLIFIEIIYPKNTIWKYWTGKKLAKKNSLLSLIAKTGMKTLNFDEKNFNETISSYSFAYWFIFVNDKYILSCFHRLNYKKIQASC